MEASGEGRNLKCLETFCSFFFSLIFPYNKIKAPAQHQGPYNSTYGTPTSHTRRHVTIRYVLYKIENTRFSPSSLPTLSPSFLPGEKGEGRGSVCVCLNSMHRSACVAYSWLI